MQFLEHRIEVMWNIDQNSLVSRGWSCGASYTYSCFPKYLSIAIFVIIIYIPHTCLGVCNKLVLCLRYDLFLLLYARHI